MTPDEIRKNIVINLLALRRPPTPMPECADVILSVIRSAKPYPDANNYWLDVAGSSYPTGQSATPVQFVRAFKDYFAFGPHGVFPPKFWDPTAWPEDNQVDERLRDCADAKEPAPPIPLAAGSAPAPRPPIYGTNAFACCLCGGCVTLRGDRHITKPLAAAIANSTATDFFGMGQPAQGEPTPFLPRLFTADVLWLFYMERMGLFQILGALLDDYATTGALPIANDSLAAFVLETMVRQMKTGAASMQRERVAAYRRALGWTTSTGRALGVESTTNTALSQQFHRLIQSALGYYDARRLAKAINATATGAVSVATQTSIAETVNLVRPSLRSMDYGRVHQDTLSGIVWAVGAMGLIHELRDDIGIPKDYVDPHQLIPAAYDLLVAKRPSAATDANRWNSHHTAATYGRRLLLDLQGLAATGSIPQSTITDWLDLPETEEAFENYRTAHRNLTGIDLGAATTRVGEPGSTLAVPQEA